MDPLSCYKYQYQTRIPLDHPMEINPCKTVLSLLCKGRKNIFFLKKREKHKTPHAKFQLQDIVFHEVYANL